MSSYWAENIMGKKCGNCRRGSRLNFLYLVECSLYDDLMCEGDCCPLWSGFDG